MIILESSKKIRLYVLISCVVLVFFAIIIRAAELQIIKRDILIKEARQTSERTFSVTPVRGEIFDRGGQKLATSVAAHSVFADGRNFKDRGEATYQLANEALDIDFDTLATRAEKIKKHGWLKRLVSPAEAQAVKDLLKEKKIKGVGLTKEYYRVYPNGNLAAHLIGFVGRDGQGLEGLELALDDKLTVESQKVKVRRDNAGRLIMDMPEQVTSQPKGASVMLTLDLRIQHIAERAIADAVSFRNAKSGMVLIMKPKTGEILASAVYPTFDPNNYELFDAGIRRNRILTDPFEPGSTFKVFTVAAALEEHLVTPDTVFFCENGLYKPDGNISTRDTRGHGDLSVSNIIKVSSNIGAIKIGEKLGAKMFYNYLTRFSFGEKTGLAYPSGEAPGRLRPPQDWHVIDQANIAFGQGISVTALQMVMAMSALANDGVLMRPQLVSRVVDAEGHIIEENSPQIIRQVVSPLTAHQVMAMLRLAVMKGGTGTKAEIPGYPVAGKTGTAQRVSAGATTYTEHKYVASFIGLAPYQNPELCVLVALEDPYPAYYGGEVAAPVFKEIVSEALPLLDVPRLDTEEEVVPYWPSLEKNNGGVPGVTSGNQSVNFFRMVLKKNDQGDPGPIPDFALEENTINDRELVFDEPLEDKRTALKPPDADGSPGTMPDLAGLSMREVLDITSEYGLELDFKGSGLAISQEPVSGMPVLKGQMARIYFEPR